MTMRSIGDEAVLSPDPGTPEDDLSPILARMGDNDLLYLAVSLAKQKAVRTEEFLTDVALNFEILKRRRRGGPRLKVVAARGGGR
jgi:hypothetical protein